MKQKIVGRNYATIVINLQVMQNHPIAGGNDEFRYLGKFQRNNPPTFKGSCDTNGVQT